MLLGYEEDHFGGFDVVVMRFLGKGGEDWDDRVDLLDDIKVNPDEHALGRSRSPR